VKLGDCSLDELNQRLQGSGLCWHTGPFTVQLKASIPTLTSWLHKMYGEHPLVSEPGIVDFHINMTHSRGLRRWRNPQAHFILDGNSVFAPFPLDHAPPLFEWGMNLCIAGRANRYLLLHTAVVAKGDRALLLSGIPGSGKSTLCAALVVAGWRLFSDEFALLRPEDGMVIPLARPAALKNQSIDIIRKLGPKAVVGPEFPKTRKGTVAHLQPPPASVHAQGEAARPAWVICPQYRAGATPHLEPLPKDRAFLHLSANSFNYEVMGAAGFNAIAAVVDSCPVHNFSYDDLGDAVAVLEELTGGTSAGVS
jgi:HprK-related kinase A